MSVAEAVIRRVYFLSVIYFKMESSLLLRIIYRCLFWRACNVYILYFITIIIIFLNIVFTLIRSYVVCLEALNREF
jgi:hypothetical protein